MVSMSLSNASRKMIATIEVAQCMSRQDKDDCLIAFGTGPGGKRAEFTLSGMSIGEHCWGSKSVSSASLQLVADRYSVDVMVGFKREEVTGAAAAENLAIAERLCEKIARRALSEAMAVDLDDQGKPTSTANLTGLEADKRGYVPLATWASSHYVTISYDESTATASFAYRGKQVKLPLASHKAVVNGTQKDLDGKFILARGTKWFVPAIELEDAIG